VTIAPTAMWSSVMNVVATRIGPEQRASANQGRLFSSSL
jgi:hypothetical protein